MARICPLGLRRWISRWQTPARGLPAWFSQSETAFGLIAREDRRSDRAAGLNVRAFHGEGASLDDGLASIGLDGRRPFSWLPNSTKGARVAVIWPNGLCIQTQRSMGPQKEQFTRLTLPSTFGPTSTQTESVAAPPANKLPVGNQETGRLHCSTSTARRQRIGPQAEEVAVGAASLRLGELVSHAVSEAKGVQHVMPVGAGQLEGDALRVHPFAVRIVRIVSHAERPEVDVLDMADVVALVHIDAALARVAGNIANQVPPRIGPG